MSGLRNLLVAGVASACFLASSARAADDRAGRADAAPPQPAATAAASAPADHFRELADYERKLARDPGDRAALRGKIQTLARLGAFQLALELAQRNPGVLGAAEQDAIAADRTAHLIRWGVIAADTGLGTARFAALDRALLESDAAGLRALDPSVEPDATGRQLALDRIVALSARFRMRDAVQLYEAMAARAPAVPAYVLAAAASAYLYLEQPRRARDLYRQALVTDPDNLQSRVGLFYALAENEQHREALDVIQRAATDTPLWIDAWSPATIRENPDYALAWSARAMAPLLANRPGEAEQRLGDLSDRAPFNMELRTDQASSMRARGWPRGAEAQLRWILAADPNNSGARGEHAGALLEMRDYEAAGRALAGAQAVAAEDGRVVRAARLVQVHGMRELIVEAGFGRAGGGPTGTRDQSIESWLYSAPIAHQYRAFGHVYSAEARFATGTGHLDRAGVGLEYRSPAVVAAGELAHGINESRNGAAASLSYAPNDVWTLRGSAATSANETPLQARLAGIDARRVGAEAQWRAHESRSASLALSTLDFSDGNRRSTTLARWTERVVAGPVYRLEITAALYASHNTRGGVAYFNPARDFSPTVEFANEWIQWRRYTRAFRHRLVLSAGSYRQDGFAAGRVGGVRYEQEWEAADRLTLRYGIGRGLHPYDGVQTGRNFAYLSLNWRF